MSILVVGCGKMGGAMVRGWIASMNNDCSVQEPSSTCSDSDSSPRSNLSSSTSSSSSSSPALPTFESFKPERIVVVDPFVNDLPVLTVPDRQSIPEDFSPDVVLFAVKPPMLPKLIADYKTWADKALYISVSPGNRFEFMESVLGENARIVRLMPQVPCAICKGVTPVCPNDNVDDKYRRMCESLMRIIADEVVWIPSEDNLDASLAVASSGAAFVFEMMEKMADAGEKLGLPREKAELLTMHTFSSSADYALRSLQSNSSGAKEDCVPVVPGFAELKALVLNPGGPTAAGLASLSKRRIGATLFDALNSAYIVCQNE